MRKSTIRDQAWAHAPASPPRRPERLSDAPNSLRHSLYACERSLEKPLKRAAPPGARCQVRDLALTARLERWLRRLARLVRGVLGALFAFEDARPPWRQGPPRTTFPSSSPARRDEPDPGGNNEG
jgi:hypothetical protein